MRILQVIESMTRGGAERLALELAREFAAAGHQSGILCLSAPGPWAETLKVEGLYAGCIAKRLGADLTCIERLARFIRDYDADIVNTHLFTANLWTRLAGLARRRWRLVVTLHNIDSWRRPIHKALDHCLSRAADHYVAVAAPVAAYWRKNGAQRTALTTIPNAVRCNATTYTRPLESLPATIRACGRLVPQKGFHILVEAASLMAASGIKFDLEIIGEGPERARLESMVMDKGLCDEVRFLGERDDARSLVAEADMVALPSLREGLPLVLLEAMHAGRPIVATRLDAVEYALTHEREGLLVKPGSPAALAKGMERMIALPGCAAAMGLAAKNRAGRDFAIKRVADSYLRLYQDLVPGGSP